MKGIYLASFKAYHKDYDIDYQDINGKRDIGGDMMDVDLSKYDYIIATPPCNYWSRANYRRDESEYALKTKHLLPNILDKLRKQKKPYIVENVRNEKLFHKHKMFEKADFVYFVGRHTYWTNIMINFNNIEQTNDFFALNKRIPNKKGYFLTPDGRVVKSAGQNITNASKKNRQGGKNVYVILEHWLEVIHEKDNS